MLSSWSLGVLQTRELDFFWRSWVRVCRYTMCQIHLDVPYFSSLSFPWTSEAAVVDSSCESWQCPCLRTCLAFLILCPRALPKAVGSCFSLTGQARSTRRKTFFGKTLKPISHFGGTILRHFLEQGCQTHFHQGPHQPGGCLQRTKCNFRTV